MLQSSRDVLHNKLRKSTRSWGQAVLSEQSDFCLCQFGPPHSIYAFLLPDVYLGSNPSVAPNGASFTDWRR
jgi:hypothetical protein